MESPRTHDAHPPGSPLLGVRSPVVRLSGRARGLLLGYLPGPLRVVAERLLTREVLMFLLVGGSGYVVDVATFNWLRSVGPTATLDPAVARTLAVVVAMCVTYAGNRTMTWRGHTTRNRRRELALFVAFNAIGFLFSVLTLFVSHDLMHLTTRLADNISANVVGLALGTIFRFLTYKHVVFVVDEPQRTSQPLPQNLER